MRCSSLIAFLLAATALSGCDLFGTEAAEKLVAAKEAEGKAIGGACRHAGRAIEDCYAMNRKADKAAVFTGWRDMNDYMRENKIESVPPQSMAGKASVEKSGEGASTEVKSGAAKPVADSGGELPIERKPAKVTSGGKPRESKGHD